MAVVLVGASGLAKEALAVLREQGENVVGVLDDRFAELPRFGAIPVVGGIDSVSGLPDVDVVVCVGPSRGRLGVVARLAQLGVGPERHRTVLDPSVRNPDRCPIGPGSILLAGVVVTAAAQIGAHVVAMPHVTITHECHVADGATFAAGVSLGGGVEVGEGAYLGMNSCIRPGLRIGRFATVGMGAVVLSDIPDGETWAGVPARTLGGQS